MWRGCRVSPASLSSRGDLLNQSKVEGRKSKVKRGSKELGPYGTIPDDVPATTTFDFRLSTFDLRLFTHRRFARREHRLQRVGVPVAVGFGRDDPPAFAD